MIVYCEKCNSKFQVDDAKIPDAGIKARCSVCSHAFFLKKEPIAAPVAPKPSTEPTPAADFDFGDKPPAKTAATAASQPAATRPAAATAADSFFARTTVESQAVPAKEPANEDIVVEIAEGGLDDVQDIYEPSDQVVDRFADVFASNRATMPGTAARVVEASVKADIQKEQASQRPLQADAGLSAADADMNRFGFASPKEDRSVPDSDPVVQKISADSSAAARFPEVIPSGGQLPSNQVMGRPEREIISKLDEVGLTDDYVVEMVHQICNAVKYVEGVEKPDWPTRMMGLEMLCKIKGLFPGEKKDDANRQVQIVTGINM